MESVKDKLLDVECSRSTLLHQLGTLQTEENVKDKLLEVEQSHSAILQQLNKLDAANSEGERKEEEFHQVIEDQEKEICLLREQVS